jgi:hypothetical protein
VTLAMAHWVATGADIPTLTRINQQLIDDAWHRNPKNLAELEMRMRSMLAGNYTATLFESPSLVMAYALWREEPEWVYLRLFKELRHPYLSVVAAVIGYFQTRSLYGGVPGS